MEANKELDDILLLLDSRRLSEAIDMLGAFGGKYPELNIAERLDGIRADYERMADYWAQGYSDPQLEDIYTALLRRMYGLTADVSLRYAMTHSGFFETVGRRVERSGRDWSVNVLKAALEGFVSDVALLELEPEYVRAGRKAGLYVAHQRLMADLFDYIWISPQWNDGTAGAFTEILLSPTVDANDQQLIVSALMLSVMNVFDAGKFRVLVDVYRRSVDEFVRQRALVGWVLALGGSRKGLFTEVTDMIGGMLADGRVCDELTELQIQMLYCVSAENDHKKIQREIMPELLKHNNLHITPGGIEEKAEDPMQDILNPEESERNMEKVEESFRKMIDMQKAGSDIYFGGFSQMKRFPFFNSISNWFVPFYPEHPEISPVYEKMGHSRFLNAIMAGGPFCNSDKYSFILAFGQVIDRIPQNMRSMIDSGEMVGAIEVAEDEKRTPAYIRRTYLQDVYRFFRLYPLRSQFRNPFDYRHNEEWDADYIFFADSVFRGTPLEARFGEIGAFMLKRKMYREAAELLDNYSEAAHCYHYYMLCGHVLLHRDETLLHSHLHGLTAAACFGNALAERPDDRRALLGYARALFYDGDYAGARDAYARLADEKPETMTYWLSYGICLTNLEQYDEALKVLFRLNYEHPEHQGVSRVMARALIGAGKYGQAENVYARLEEAGKMDANDRLNLGYCEWFDGKRKAAAVCFARYLKERYPSLPHGSYRAKAEEDVIDTERAFILGHGVTETECRLMLDIVCSELVGM